MYRCAILPRLALALVAISKLSPRFSCRRPPGVTRRYAPPALAEPHSGYLNRDASAMGFRLQPAPIGNNRSYQQGSKIPLNRASVPQWGSPDGNDALLTVWLGRNEFDVRSRLRLPLAYVWTQELLPTEDRPCTDAHSARGLAVTGGGDGSDQPPYCRLVDHIEARSQAGDLI
jgi:hypothetical protein